MAPPAVINSPSPLQPRDIFVLTRSSKLQDDVKDDAGEVTSPACGFVQGLRASGLPFYVLGQKDKRRDRPRWERAVEDAALAKSDRITVAHVTTVFGMERKVKTFLSSQYFHPN